MHLEVVTGKGLVNTRQAVLCKEQCGKSGVVVIHCGKSSWNLCEDCLSELHTQTSIERVNAQYERSLG